MLKRWLPAIVPVLVSVTGFLYVTGAFAGSEDPAGWPPPHFLEVTPQNRCAPGQGAGPRASRTIFRGGRADGQALEYLQSIGVRSIMDLETPDQIRAEEELERSLGLGFRELEHPMNDGMGVNHLSDGSDDDESIISAVAELRNSGNFPIYLHCHFGDDRTGLVVALHRVFDECWSPEDAEAEWRNIAGFWHDLGNFPKHMYFHKVMEDPVLYLRYQNELQLGSLSGSLG